MVKTFAIAASAAVIALLAGTAWFVTRGSDDAFADCRSGVISGGAGSIGGPFTLVSETGQTVTDKDVLTKPSLVYFGYTFCPDVCPLDSARNADAADLLEDRGHDVQTVFISIDPERDTPEVVGEFTNYFDEDMLGLTGSPEQVKDASAAYKTYYSKQDGDDDYYLVDHSTFTYLMLPDSGFADFFRRDETAEEVAERAQCFLDATN